MKTKFTSNIARLRKAKGLSQQKLAELSGLTRRQIAYYENEANTNLIDNLNAIAKAMGVSLADLIEIKNGNKQQNDLLQIDSRAVGKIKKLLSLSKSSRYSIYNMIDAFYQKNKNE